MMMKLYLFTLWFFVSSLGYAQTGETVITNAGHDLSTLHTKIKWYSESIYYEHGVNIYRLEEGSQNWQKLNEVPLLKGRQVSADELAGDHNSRLLTEITSQKSGEELEGLVKLSVLIHSVLHEKFALYLGLQFNDSTVELGKTYTYRIMQVLANKEEKLISTTAPITVAYRKESQPPSDITLTVSEKEVGFTWKIEEDRFFAVNVYRGDTPDGAQERLNTRPVMVTSSEDEQGNLSLPEHFFVDDSLESGKDYYYQLRSIDYFGEESAPTEAFHVITIDNTPPPTPQLGSLRNNQPKELRWKQKKVDDLAGFNIYRSNLTDTLYTKLNDTLVAVATNTWQLSDNSPGSYWYYVEAVDRAGNTAKSEPILVSIPDEAPPAAPANVEAFVEPGKIRITWTENQEPDMLGYLVFRALNQGHSPAFYPMSVQPQPAAYYEQKVSLTNKEKYLYKIVALDTSYNQSPFSRIVNVRLPDVNPPEAPFLKDVYVANEGVTIEWLPLSDEDLQGYALFRSEEAGDFTKIATLTPQLDIYTDSNIQAGMQYQYYLTAMDTAGNTSTPSTVLSALTPGQATLTIALKGKYNKRQQEVEIKWKVNRPDQVKGFVVYQSVGSAPLKPVTGLVTDMLFLDHQLKAGQRYQYQVRAYDHQGNSFQSENFEIGINE